MRPSIFLLEHALHDWGGADAVHCHLGYGGRPWKKNAVEKSLKSLREAIDKWKGENGVTGPVSEIAEIAEADPLLAKRSTP